MKLLLKVLCALFIVVSPAFAADGVITDRTKVCMMQDTVMEQPGIPIQHEGKTYYGCCAMCGKAIEAEPEKHTKAIDVVSGVKVDKATAPIYSYQGRAFYFASEAARDAFARDPVAHLARHMQSGAIH